MIKYKIDNEFLVVYLPQRIDASSAAGVESDILDVCRGNQHGKLVLDAGGTEFISSTGLRVLLNLKSRNEDIRIVGVSAEVYNVFDITGFTRIFTIDRAFRRVELRPENLLGRGAAGAVYRINGDEIVKVPYKHVSPEELKAEIQAAQQALIHGVPTAISYDVVECQDGHLGTVYEAINSQTLSSYIMSHTDEFDSLVDKYVALLKTIHSNNTAPDSLPRLDKLFVDYLNELRGTVSDESVDRLLAFAALLPVSDTLVHGDCHPKNVMINNGELLFIDIADISVGHPMFDLIGFYMAEIHLTTFFSPEDSDVVSGMSKQVRQRFTCEVLRRYFGYSQERLDWLMGLMAELVIFMHAAFIVRRLPVSKARDIITSQIVEWAASLDSAHVASLKRDVDSWTRDF